MFTGIVEALGEVRAIEPSGSNVNLWISADFSHELAIDQSVAHNGCCLTVVEIADGQYKVTAIEETMKRTNLGTLKVGSVVNLERCMRMNARLDGHIVQGHVDTTATCTQVDERDGSWYFHFSYGAKPDHITVEKGSICINGTSLTVVDSTLDSFSVAIIPYTYEHTNFRDLKAGDLVNLEFDIIGKYVARLLEARG